MHKLIYTALAGIVVSVLAPLSSSQAATYAFEATSLVNNPSNQPLLDLTPGTFPEVSISIQDSAIESGSFSATYTSNPAAYGGDYNSLISFNIGDFVTLTPASGGVSTFRANFLFDADGRVSAGALFYSSDQFEVDLAGSAALFQGAFAPSSNGYTGSVGGTFTAVPEPASLVLLSGGVICLCLIRRRIC